MSRYDFDKVIDRKGTNSLKFDFALERGKSEDVLPLWVADMDFQTAPGIVERLQTVVGHGIFGYAGAKNDYFDAVINHYRKNFDWEIKKEWIIKTPGVVFGLGQCIRAFTNKKDKILIQRPVYYPFSEVINNNDRILVNNPLVEKDGKYFIDFEDFEAKCKDPDLKMFILCSPHNPVGRVWTKEELQKIGDICLENNVIVVSDEIHNDFVWEDHKHIVFSQVDKRFEQNTIIATSPSKSFNLAGLQISNYIIQNGDLKSKFCKAIGTTGYSNLPQLGIVACQAAYETGEDWLVEVKKYIWENILYSIEFTKDNLAGVKFIKPEGTYLCWLDFRGLDLDKKGLSDLINNKAKLWLDEGFIFGPEGEGFERINVACPRSVLEEAYSRLARAISQI